ncbi:hypothetical protein DL766_008414 [Monosporascus sp. MC13-8B]|uniref:Uncharacterized protein n=1 Tax=Monosporascus cannonballus TaxID=155416 RepID=A0ABY0GYD6_9PEZI|nr:hypothetical protein DL762_008048 [Monosporascus cannonballus]RYO84464.1 hypothetical protein DL763_007449 [Monosporascus cannonballus]RYP19591.1 hypothetical protein DL766_008414 [Monosporascus sp. MC13-8B]
MAPARGLLMRSRGLPEPALNRLKKAGVDLSNGYPYNTPRPLYLQHVYQIRDGDRAPAQRHGAACEELGPDFRKIIDGGLAIYRSAHPYLARDDRRRGPDRGESGAILKYLFHVFQSNVDIQNHGSQRALGLRRHTSQAWDSGDVIAEKPYFDPNAPTERQALGCWTKGSCHLMG